jgi:hypothetical protein
MTTEHYNKLGRITALISFLIGTVIFGLYYQTSQFNYLFIGYIFIALAGIVNFVLLILICFKSEKEKDVIKKKKLFRTCSLMLLNIPVLIFYIWVSTILLNTMRITFTNYTGAAIKDIKIEGCSGGYIDKIENGEHKTVWITITGDCSLNIEYSENGQLKTETVSGYLTTSMGQKMIHTIGKPNSESF